MSSVSCTSCSTPAQPLQSSKPPVVRAADGDTVAQEAAESSTTKLAETSNAGYAPHSGAVNKVA